MEDEVYDYVTFPRRFLAYKWFKPLLVALLTIVFSILLSGILMFISFLWLGKDPMVFGQSQDSANPLFYQGPGMLMGLGAVATFIPSLALATLIVKDRPFSSYSSSRGGFNWGAYIKYLIVSLLFVGAIGAAFAVLFPDSTADGVNKFNTAGLIVFATLVLFQGAGEEYIYRGLIMQAIGSWTKLPVVAIVLSSLIFAFSHNYNIFGLIAVFIDGAAFAYVTWRTRGLEAACAMHGANNFIAVLLSGLGFIGRNSGDIISLVGVVIIQALFVASAILIEKKFHWCKPKSDGLSAHNDKYLAKHDISS